MASVTATLQVRVRDMDRTRLFVHELTELADEMRVMASPHAERLERALARYIGGGDDEGAGEIVDSTVTEEVIVEPCPHCGFEEAAQS